MKILYYDCFAGISGDMNLGAMIDLGVNADMLRNELKKLPLHGYKLKIYRDTRKGISGTKVDVVVDDHHNQTTYSFIKKMIKESGLKNNVQKISLDIFHHLARAEAKIHNTEIDNVHFHEVGAVDSIVDIVGAAICIDQISPEKVLCSTIELGSGQVHCSHGTYPVPAPATAEILRNIPVRKGNVDHEASTPTGAAILAAVVDDFTDNVDLTILETGYGIGTKDTSVPNVLRLLLCETNAFRTTESVPSLIVECNIDDMNAEWYDYVIDSLFKAGANDVYITPIIMKKSRPAVKLSVLCIPEVEESINEVLFRETSTIGVRKYSVGKTVLERKTEDIHIRYGNVRIKSAFYQGKCIKSKPEYDDCSKLARDNNIPISDIYREVEKELAKKKSHHE